MTRPGAHDPVGHAHVLHDMFESVMAGDEPHVAPRSLISASWERSLAAHVDPDRRMPRAVHSDDEMADLRAAHPLDDVMPLLRSTLVSIADEAMHVMLVTDANGTILWREGATRLLHAADATGLTPGFSVSEASIGTNAMGTTLAVDAPVQIHSAEHLVRAYHIWTCAAAPVHDPDTGADPRGDRHLRARSTRCTRPWPSSCRPQRSSRRTSCGCASPSPTSACACATCRTSRACAAGRARSSRRAGGSSRASRTGRGPRGSRCPPTADASRSTTGARWRSSRSPRATCCTRRAARPRPATAARCRCGSPATPRRGPRWTAGRCPLTLRPAELLTVLALHPDGRTAEQLAAALYGDDGNPTTVRGEVLRLRGLIGAEVLRTRPYRLDAVVDTDFGAARRALHAGQVAEALRACAGPLLPRSDAPGDPRTARRAGRGPAASRARRRRRRAARRVRRAPPRRGRPGDPRPAGRRAPPARPPAPRHHRQAHPPARRVGRPG